MPKQHDHDSEDVLSTTAKALDVRSIGGDPYPMMTPEDLVNDIIDRTVVWTASQQAMTEDQLLLSAGAILHSISLECLRSAGHGHDDDGNPIGHDHD
jgi:hypothetical protein